MDNDDIEMEDIFKGKKILVVEDNYISYKLIEANFRKYDVQLLYARDAEESLRLFKENPDISFILMDVQLPGMSGLDATRKIRESNQEVPIIAVTANVFEDDKLACFDAGCTSFIGKPIHFPSLLDIMKNYL